MRGRNAVSNRGRKRDKSRDKAGQDSFLAGIFYAARKEQNENQHFQIHAGDGRLDEIIEIMLDAVCSNSPTIRINGEDMPQQVVKSRFLKLNSSHIDYVFDAMRDCPSDIRNIRAYLLTTLYNATLTIDNYYAAKVNHDYF